VSQSALLARRTDAGIAKPMSRKRNAASDVEGRPDCEAMLETQH
jgi:hypothetical protein